MFCRGRGHVTFGRGVRALMLTAFMAFTVSSCNTTSTGAGTVGYSSGLAEELKDGSVADLASYLEKPVAQGASPGLWAAIIDGNGVRAVGAAGVRRQGVSRSVTVDDLLHIGSNTKAMTATMLATLVEDGTFARGWETTIIDVFPEFREDIHEKYHAVTLSQLVRMEGGMDHMPRDQWAYSRTLDIIDRRYRIIRDSLEDPFRVSVGSYAYSNLSYVVAAAMAERLTGKSWETLMHERLFEPLGITTAGFGPPGGSSKGMDQPWGHDRNDRGNWTSSKLDNDPMLGPAGTIHILIADWAKFIALWFPERVPEILDRTALEELARPDSSARDYAAGWFVFDRSSAGGRVMQHDGSNLSWRSNLWIVPERGLAYLAVANAADFHEGDDTFWTVTSIIYRLVEDGPALVSPDVREES